MKDLKSSILFWISEKTEQEKNRPFLTFDGKKITLNELIIEIENDTELAQRLLSAINNFAIEMFLKEKN